ncbi:MAG: hypothetical protein K0U45_06090 [Alphaproteobacteria bacterium]|nr:hypothetical protein [Alphaproteobacteria bacterium]
MIHAVSAPFKKILFLGYERDKTRLIDALIEYNCDVHYGNQPIDSVNYDLIVSFGYRHIFKKRVLDALNCPIVNLHISYLPFNRGAHPNFWSFYEGTQSGVSIHLIDKGVDTGPIIFQKKVDFIDETTFAQTYHKLINEIEDLFIANIQDIIECNWVEKPQIGDGSFHLTKDLPQQFRGWDCVITDEIKRLKAMRTT